MANNISVYPNPASDQLTIEGLSENGVIKISLINKKGVNVLTEREINGHTHVIQVQNIPAGMYMLEITGEKGRLLKKVMIE